MSNDQQRRELVEWNPALADLVFRGTTAKVSAFWAALCGPTGMKGFLDQNPEVSARAARDVLRLAGERFCSWPDDDTEQAKARNRPDPRFEVAESDPAIRGGRLCFIGTSRYFEILFDNLHWYEDCSGATLDDLVEWYELPKAKTSRAVMIAAELFSEGLVPDENLPGRGRSPADGKTPPG